MKKEKVFMISFLMFVFLCFLCFYTSIHPIIMFDTDDWGTMSIFRDATPSRNMWNPARVFAETFMPLAAKLGAYVLCPLLPNAGFFKAMTVVFAIAVSSAITFLVLQLFLLIRQKSSCMEAAALLVLFLLSIFWIFRSRRQNNDYMLYTIDACTYFYYVIPNLLCCSAVLILMRRLNSGASPQEIWRGWKGACFTALVYFCIFSNIWASVILAVYVGTMLLIKVLSAFRTKEKASTFLKKWWPFLLILAAWSVEQIFEVSGRRAASLSQSTGYIASLKETVTTFLSLCSRINGAYAVFSLAVPALAVLHPGIRRGIGKQVVFFAANAVLVLLYVLITCAKAGAGYVSRTDVIFGVFFWVECAEICCLMHIIRKFPSIKKWSLLALLLIFFTCDTTGKTYKETFLGNIEPEAAYRIDDDILLQLQEADRRGEKETRLLVPKFDHPDNWPIATYAKSKISYTAYEYGLTENIIEITEIVPSEEKNYLKEGYTGSGHED